MSQILIASAEWLHALATVVFIGYYVVLAAIVLPALLNSPTNDGGVIVTAISKRSRFWLYGALAIFAVTGVYLTLVDPSYMGLGNFGNVWAIAMLVKHVIVLVMIGIGFWYNAILRVGPLASSNTGAAQAIARFRSYVNLMAISGAVVLLLTALAQAQP
jgi:uncharacterized membrane protein